MTQDIPNTVAEAAAALNRQREEPFWQRQIELTQGRIEDHPSIKPSRYGWMIGPAIFACAAFSVGLFWI
jgi:hypothetical protein